MKRFQRKKKKSVQASLPSCWVGIWFHGWQRRFPEVKDCVKRTGFQCWWVGLLPLRMLIMLIGAGFTPCPLLWCSGQFSPWSWADSPGFSLPKGDVLEETTSNSLCLPFVYSLGQSASSENVNISSPHPWHSGGLFQECVWEWLAAHSLIISWNVICLSLPPCMFCLVFNPWEGKHWGEFGCSGWAGTEFLFQPGNLLKILKIIIVTFLCHFWSLLSP